MADDEETQEQRALRALQSILAGGDLTEETLALSNDFTDRQTGRIGAWFRGVFGRRVDKGGDNE